MRGLQVLSGSGGKAPTLGAAGEPGKALKADDPTTTDSRTPKGHAASHADGGSDELEIAAAQVSGLGTAALGDVGVDIAANNDARLEFNKNFGVAMVVYGEDVNKARPNGASHAVWVGEPGFEPVNRQKFDIVIQEHGDWE